MVAKSYQSLEQIGEPYVSNGRQYVKVKMANGSLKQVRWYTNAEYKKMYPNEEVKDEYDQKKVLGFDNGYITIFKGNTYEDREWFKSSSARYSRYWGWYFVSTEKIPEDLPSDVTPIQLSWEKVSIDNHLLPEEQVKKIVEDLVYEPEPSEWFGTVGERYKFKLYIDRVVPVDGAYGQSNIHTMKDESGNIFVWATTAKCLTPGHWYNMTGQVKEFRTYHNTKQTWLTRCLSVKEAN